MFAAPCSRPPPGRRVAATSATAVARGGAPRRRHARAGPDPWAVAVGRCGGRCGGGRRDELLDDGARGREIRFHVEGVGIGHRLHRAAADQAHGDCGDAVRGDIRARPGLAAQGVVGQGPERLSVAVEGGADLRPDGRLADTERPVLEEQPEIVRRADELLHLLPKQDAQAIRSVRVFGGVAGEPQDGRRREDAIEQRGHELILAPEVEEHEPVAQPRLRGHGAHGHAVDSGLQGDVVGALQDLLAAGLLRCLPSRHACVSRRERR